MRPERERAESLHGPWPSAVEALQAQYSDTWEIWREVGRDGHHGDWLAKRLGSAMADLHAETIRELRQFIENADLP